MRLQTSCIAQLPVAAALGVIARPVASLALMRALERACPKAHRRVSVVIVLSRWAALIVAISE